MKWDRAHPGVVGVIVLESQGMQVSLRSPEAVTVLLNVPPSIAQLLEHPIGAGFWDSCKTSS